MNKYFLIITIFIFTVQSSNLNAGQWEIVDRFHIYDYGQSYPYPIHYPAVKCLNENYCVAAVTFGWSGTANRITTNGGNSWFSTLIDTSKWYLDSSGKRVFTKHSIQKKAMDIDLPDSTLCIITADSGYYFRSTDNCRTWKLNRIDTKETGNQLEFYKIQMANNKIGCYANVFNLFLTEDGGISFQKVKFDTSQFTKDIYFWDIAMPDTNTIICSIYIGDELRIIRTEDRGKNWLISNKKAKIFKIYFFNKYHGLNYGGRQLEQGSTFYASIIYETYDGGMTWINRLDTIPQFQSYLYNISFCDSLNGIVNSRYDWNMWRTTDGGKSWFRDTTYTQANVKYNFNVAAMLTPKKMLGFSYFYENIYRYVETTGVYESGQPIITTNTDDFEVFPNPCYIGADLNLKLNHSYYGKIDISIYNSVGKLISTQSLILNSDARQLKYNITRDLSPGQYFIRILSEDGRQVVRPVVFLR
ncbi:MAG: hypothetical protein HW421_852 [Ignavibacteria bacterium]|nr:hypothetical protein [Ignavibacteria bacterium]